MGRIVCVIPDGSAIWWIRYPENRPSAKRTQSRATKKSRVAVKSQAVKYHIKAPQRVKAEVFRHDINTGSLSVIQAGFPPYWSLADKELEADVRPDQLVRAYSRAKPSDWLNARKQFDALIKEIIADYDIFALTEGGLEREQSEKQARLKKVPVDKIRQLLRRHMLGLGHRNSLLPHFDVCGELGKEKYCQTKPGRSNTVAREEKGTKRLKLRGYNLEPIDRQWLREGYKKHKKPDVSMDVAYNLTMADYYPTKVEYINSKEPRIVLKKASERPTLRQFQDHGPQSHVDRPSRINLGQAHYEGHQRPIRHAAFGRANVFGLRAFIDSSSEDQTLVSSASILQTLPSTNRTLVVEDSTEYILGLYSGHESPSSLTGLLALLNCVEDHVALCAEIGVPIEPEDWICWMPKKVTGDNGDIKQDDSIMTLEASEISNAYAKIFSPLSKDKVEKKHRYLQRKADHRNAGSTRGRKRKRGERRREEDACRTHRQNLVELVKAILQHNNQEPVPKLLTMEMRRDGVEPTRKAIVLWKIEKGYIASSPANLESLRAHCLPRLSAVIHGDGIRVRDPRSTAGDLIPGLVYSADWLYETDILTRARKQVIPIDIALSPGRLGCAYIQLNGMKELSLKTRDPELKELSLVDWLTICSIDKYSAYITARLRDEVEAERVVSNEKINQQARRAKQKEQGSLPKPPSKKAISGNKRAALKSELEAKRIRSLGLDSAPSIPEPSIDDLVDCGDSSPSQTKRHQELRDSWRQ
ncbi:hypothetical protein [Variovorax sp. OK605]|uniref:hypothetical protein n=1 Tax=Variovorax sp. OK605 TaxID=1855317 RepID=UPI0011605C27|nr:hypothetical protein [Variovorax sp. OK605]